MNRAPLTFIEGLQEKYLKLLIPIDNYNSSNDHPSSMDENKNIKERLDLICKLENKLIFDLSNDFNTSVEDLQHQLSIFEGRIKTYKN